MNTTTHFDPWHDRHEINMEPEQMDRFSDEDSLFAGQPNERNSAYVEGLINDGPTYRAVSKMIGPEDAKTLFQRCLFGTSCSNKQTV